MQITKAIDIFLYLKKKKNHKQKKEDCYDIFMKFKNT